MGDLKYKEPIELMAEEITGLGDFDPLAKTFILGQGDYPTGHRIVEVTAEEVRELRRIVSDEQARSVALTARVKELEEALDQLLTAADFYSQPGTDGMASRYAHESHARLARAALAKGDADG